jgi:hypothetical protein
MRVDLTQDGNKDVDVELNGTKIENVLWADDATGECEVFETDWRSGELVKAPDTEWGYRTMRVKGRVKINDRRPKAPAGDTVYDFQYPGMCFLHVDPARYKGGSHRIVAQCIGTFAILKEFNLNGSDYSCLLEAILVLTDRIKVHHIVVDPQGLGAAVGERLRGDVPCPVLSGYP